MWKPQELLISSDRRQPLLEEKLLTVISHFEILILISNHHLLEAAGNHA